MQEMYSRIIAKVELTDYPPFYISWNDDLFEIIYPIKVKGVG